MGAWGSGAFENDGAADWLVDLEASRSVAPLRRAFAAVNRANTDAYLDGDIGEQAIAAAEVVAAARGRAGAIVPDEVADWLAGARCKGATELAGDAAQALTRIMAHSEIADLWREGEGAEEWEQGIADLQARLAAPPEANPYAGAKKRRPRVTLKIGDVFAISLPDGRTAYAHYLFNHSNYGHLVRIFDLITETPVPLGQLADAGELFPPVYVIFKAALQDGAWRRVGGLPVEEFVHPLFRRNLGNLQPGANRHWDLWDGEEFTRIGDLPERYRRLEFLWVWLYQQLVDRIARGGETPDTRFW